MATVPDPEEQDRDATRRDGSEDTDAAFASIIANWQAEPDVPRWPAEADPTPEGPSQQNRTQDNRAQDNRAQDNRAQDNRGDEDHYEPPEPPPLPVPRPRTLGGMLLLAVGVLLLVRPSLLGLGEAVGTPLGLLTVTAGIGWLVLGLRGGPPREGWDDGAQL